MRTFYIIGGMLVITAITAKINRSFETTAELCITLISSFALLLIIDYNASSYPLNLILVGLFAAWNGWLIGPTIEHFGERFKLKRYLKNQGLNVKKRRDIPDDALAEFEDSFDRNAYHAEWQNVIFQTISATALAMISTGSIVFLTDYDFGWLGQILFICLFSLIIMYLLNALIFKSSVFALIRTYFGAVIFTLFLIYDFNRLEKLANDESWATAIDISVNIYLDIINLFLEILEIFSE